MLLGVRAVVRGAEGGKQLHDVLHLFTVLRRLCLDENNLFTHLSVEHQRFAEVELGETAESCEERVYILRRSIFDNSIRM